jgi:hypothetical protein
MARNDSELAAGAFSAPALGTTTSVGCYADPEMGVKRLRAQSTASARRSSGPRQKKAATFHEMHQKLPPLCAPIEGPLELPSGGDFTGPDCLLASTANLESRAVGASHFGLSSFP